MNSTSRGIQEKEKLIARNRRASHDFELREHYEAGLVLKGSEVKSIRLGKVELVDAFAAVEGKEIWLHQLYIAPFEQATYFGHEPRRKRKLLLKGKEIRQIDDLLKGRGHTLVPLRLFISGRRIKIEIAIGKGKSNVDKRQSIAKKEADRETRDAIARARKYGT